MIGGAIFDMDGVMVDNVRYHVRAWQQLGSELDRDLTEEAIRRTFGQRNREIIGALISPSLSDEDLARHADRKEVLYRGFMKPELKPHAGLMDFLTALKMKGIRTAVATSGPEENSSMVLDGLNIRSFFDAVTTGADVSRSKPDPEIFLLSAEKLGLPPERCVVFEDSISGIEAARRAGCPCVGVATTHRPEELEALNPDRIILDFRDLRPEDLLR